LRAGKGDEWAGFSPSTWLFLCEYHSTHIVCTPPHLHTNLTRRRFRRSPETFEVMLFHISGSSGQKSTCSLYFRYSKC